jgi:signal peptide peptidase SppA
MPTMIDMSARFIGRPVLVSEEYAQTMAANVVRDLMVEDLRAQTAAMWLDVSTGTRKPYRMQGSIAVIPINGKLYNKIDWAGYSYTGYNWVASMLDFAARDHDVKGVMLDIDSGGGEVDGAFETAERIRSFQKPIQVSATHAYSAAYLLGSAANKISVTQTGGVGSIGVVTMHVDYSKAMEKDGIAVTLIHKGKHKVDGNPYEPLPKDVRARTEARLEETYSLFVDAVSKGRSMEAQAVRDTEALTYGAKEAKDLGLVDSVASLDQALAAFEAELTGKTRGNSMTVATDNTQTTGAAQPGSNASTVTQASVDAAKAEGAKEGALAERTRIMGIVNCEEAKGREKLAQVLCEQGMSVDAAKAILAAAATAPAASAAATTATNGFAAAMNSTPNPNISTEQASAVTTEEPAWMRSISAYNQATGANVKIN